MSRHRQLLLLLLPAVSLLLMLACRCTSGCKYHNCVTQPAVARQGPHQEAGCYRAMINQPCHCHATNQIKHMKQSTMSRASGQHLCASLSNSLPPSGPLSVSVTGLVLPVKTYRLQHTVTPLSAAVIVACTRACPCCCSF